MCAGLGKDMNTPVDELAVFFADFSLNEINKPESNPLKLMDFFAVEGRKETWKREGLYSGGPGAEIITALSKCMTNINNDPIDLIKTALRLGIANEYVALWGITVIQDVILGTAELNESPTNISCLDPDTVNIVANGHQSVFASVVMQTASSDEYQ